MITKQQYYNYLKFLKEGTCAGWGCSDCVFGDPYLHCTYSKKNSTQIKAMIIADNSLKEIQEKNYKDYLERCNDH